ncbi:MAG: ATP-binding protein [Smithella sp.]
MTQPTYKDLGPRIQELEEESIKKSAEKKTPWQLPDFFNFLPDATFIIDIQGKVIFWNRAIEEMTGIKSSDMLGKNNYEYALPFYGERRPILIDLILKSQQEIEAGYIFFERENNSLKGEAYLPAFREDEAYLCGTAGILHDLEGNIIGAIESIRNDIALCRKVKRKLYESQVHQNPKIEAFYMLAGGIAHDFNNILSAVTGYSEMGLTEQRSDRIQRYFEQIYKAGKKAEDLVKQLIIFNHSRDKKLYAMRIDPMVKEVLKFIRTTLPPTIEIQIIQSSPCTVLTNLEYIYQILLNLYTTAAHITEKGILKVELGPEKIKPGDDLINRGLNSGMHAKLTVSITGQGMFPEIMDKTFNPFFTRKPGESIDKGLSVVQEIVRKCGGAITVQNKVGKGTTFNIYFPLLMEMQE